MDSFLKMLVAFRLALNPEVGEREVSDREMLDWTLEKFANWVDSGVVYPEPKPRQNFGDSREAIQSNLADLPGDHLLKPGSPIPGEDDVIACKADANEQLTRLKINKGVQ